MSRFAQVVVLAPLAREVMEPLTRDDPERTWRGPGVAPVGLAGERPGADP
ncbi:hypothetical protein [Streptomyces sp. NBC_01515]